MNPICKSALSWCRIQFFSAHNSDRIRCTRSRISSNCECVECFHQYETLSGVPLVIDILSPYFKRFTHLNTVLHRFIVDSAYIVCSISWISGPFFSSFTRHLILYSSTSSISLDSKFWYQEMADYLVDYPVCRRAFWTL